MYSDSPTDQVPMSVFKKAGKKCKRNAEQRFILFLSKIHRRVFDFDASRNINNSNGASVKFCSTSHDPQYFLQITKHIPSICSFDEIRTLTRKTWNSGKTLHKRNFRTVIHDGLALEATRTLGCCPEASSPGNTSNNTTGNGETTVRLRSAARDRNQARFRRVFVASHKTCLPAMLSRDLICFDHTASNDELFATFETRELVVPVFGRFLRHIAAPGRQVNPAEFA